MSPLAPLVSVIVPVYNAQATLPVTLQALAQQVYTPVQYIFVNDSSTDDSLQLLQQFKANSKQAGVTINIITQPVNGGVALARNTGLQHATGKYIYFADADDTIEPDTLSASVALAQSTQAQIVGFSWYLSFSHNERKMHQPAFTSAAHALQLLMAGAMRWNLWLFLIQRSLFTSNNIQFLPGQNMGEDMLIMLQLFCRAHTVASLPQAFYHYKQSDTSISKEITPANVAQVSANLAAAEQYLQQHNCMAELPLYLNFLKLNIKLPLLISTNTAHYKQWQAWYPESNTAIMQNKYLPIRTRLLQLAAAKKLYWLVKLYNKLILHIVYGKLYK